MAAGPPNCQGVENETDGRHVLVGELFNFRNRIVRGSGYLGLG